MSNTQARPEGDQSSIRDSGKGAEHESAALKMSHEALHAFEDHAPLAAKVEATVNHEVQHMLHGFSINHGDQNVETQHEPSDHESSKHKQQSGKEMPEEQAEDDPLKKEKAVPEVPAPVDSHSLEDLQGQRNALQAMNLNSDGVRVAMAVIETMISQFAGLGEAFAAGQSDSLSPDASTDAGTPSDATEPPPSSMADAYSQDRGQDEPMPAWMQGLSGYQLGDWN